MFVNPGLGEIFLINSDDSTIHAASRLSAKCGINGEQNGHFGILPCDNPQEREMMIEQFGREYAELHLCPHCFAEELEQKRRREADAAEKAQEKPAGK